MNALSHFLNQQGPHNAAFKDIFDAVSQHEWPRFIEAIRMNALKRYLDFFKGTLHYQKSSFTRQVEKAPVLFQEGAASIRDYGEKYGLKGTEKGIVLFIPSLINKPYVFDIPEHDSLFSYLADNGYRSLLVDWGEMGEKEQCYGLSDYMQKSLLPLLHKTQKHFSSRPIVLVGYCMGGILTMAAASHVKTQGIALFAVPWNFSSSLVKNRHLINMVAAFVLSELKKSDKLSGEFLNALFHLMNPLAVLKKFQTLPSLPSQQQESFIALEDWVNDCVDLSPTVAKECFIDWYRDNQLATSGKISGLSLDPASLTLPIFCVVPKNDKIIPAASALSLAELFSHKIILEPPLGHVGMITAQKARKLVWKPFLEWVSTQCTITKNETISKKEKAA
jgi:polyhydroxyalkanoate synthase